MDTDINVKNSILTADAAQRRLRRMALQIAEENIGEKEIIILGIAGNGEVLAKLIFQELKSLVPLHVQCNTIRINKREPLDAVLENEMDVEGKVTIVVDDVSNTGRTMLYALKPLLNSSPKKIQTLVLVERSHKLFAVQSDYVGLTVSTTLQEHITVTVEEGKITGAYLH